MGDWSAQIRLRVRQALRAELEELAARERRRLGNVGTILLEWGAEQLKPAGSIERLLKYKILQSENGKVKTEKWATGTQNRGSAGRLEAGATKSKRKKKQIPHLHLQKPQLGSG